MMTRAIAEYVANVKLADLPGPVRHEGVRAFLNWLGCTIGGSQHEIVDIADRALAEFSGPGHATVVGRRRKYDLFLASCLNCMSSSVHTFDDTHAEAMVHPTGPVAAAALAIAEWQKTTGADFLLALCLGIEMECRLSKAISVPPAKGTIAWSQTGIAGGFGVAVTVGKLLGLTVEQMTWAMGTAVSQAAGFRGMHGSMNLHMMHGRTAPSGIRAALLARKGFTSSEVGIEGKFGFASVFAETANLDALTQGLGSTFELSANTYKPYPCGIVIHPIIDACLHLRSKIGDDVGRIAEVRVSAYPVALTLTYRKKPKDELDAQVSLYHWASAALVRGCAGLDETTPAALFDPEIVALQNRIHATADPSLAIDQAEVTVVLSDDRSFHHRVEHCVGSLSRPMTDEQLERKFKAQAQMVSGSFAIDSLLKDCWRLPELADVAAIAGVVA